MARIIGGIAASHTPTIGFAYDRNSRNDPAWAPIFEQFAPLAAWLAERRPDVLLQIPVPSARRFYKLGQALRRAIESYPEDLRVALVATGGLSHQVHGERCGFNNPEWDARFMDLFERDPERLADMTLAEYATLGGFEGAEIVMWLTMRGALPAKVECRHRGYYLPSMTGIATAVYEVPEVAPDAAIVARHCEH